MKLTCGSKSAFAWSSRMRVIRMPSVPCPPLGRSPWITWLPGVAWLQLVDLDAEQPQQRLLEGELHPRGVVRVDEAAAWLAAVCRTSSSRC